MVLGGEGRGSVGERKNCKELDGGVGCSVGNTIIGFLNDSYDSCTKLNAKKIFLLQVLGRMRSYTIGSCVD